MAKRRGGMREAVAVASGNIITGKVTGKVISISEDWEDNSLVKIEIASGSRGKHGYQSTSTITVPKADAGSYSFGEEVTINTEVQRPQGESV